MMPTTTTRTVGGIGGGVLPERARSSDHLVEEFVPSSAWDEDNHSHFLLINLPGFRKEEVSLQVDNGGKQLMVTGERLVKHNQYVYFHQTYQLPGEILDTYNITGTFEGQILYVKVPKHEATTVERILVATTLNSTSPNEGRITRVSGSHIAEFGKSELEKWECCGEGSVMLRAIGGVIGKHKGIVTAVVIAFTLGVLVSPKFSIRPSPRK